MSDQKTFSIRTVVLTSIVTLAISGVGGAFINQYFERAQPFSYIQSVSFFTSPSDSIQLSDTLLKASQSSYFLKKYLGYIPADELERDFAEYAEKQSRLIDLESRLTQWETKGFMQRKDEAFTATEIEDMPFITNADGRETVERLIASIPSNTSVRLLTKCKQVVQVNYSSSLNNSVNSLEVVLSGRAFLLQSAKPGTGSDFYIWYAFRNAINCGFRQSLITYYKAFKTGVQTELDYLKIATDEIRSLLQRNARLKVEVVLHNKGNKPFLISPLASLVLPGTKLQPISLRIQPIENFRELDSTRKIDGIMHNYINEVQGRQTQESSGFKRLANPLLPSGGLFRYASVSRLETANIVLESSSKLEPDKFAQLSQLFEAGAVEAKVVLTLEGGGKVESTPTAFGKIGDR
jgi:hypothetical protein